MTWRPALREPLDETTRIRLKMSETQPCCLYCGERLKRSMYHGQRYGYNGHGMFCSLRHGYGWALRHIHNATGNR